MALRSTGQHVDACAMQKRRLIKVVKIRLADALVGDVVNRDATSQEGWFEVASLDTLFNGSLQVADETTYITITGGTFDTIALQVVTEVDLPTQARPAAPEAEPVAPEVASELAQPAAH
jgi:hypothetical protein